MKTTLIVDSCCDLKPGLLHLTDVRQANFLIDVEDEHFVDGPDLNMVELLARMRASKNPVKTSFPSVHSYMEKMRTAGDCFVVAISGRLSGSYDAAMTARSLVLEEFPEKKIHVFDTKSAASAETCTALRIQECLEQGLSFDETVKEVSAYIASLHTVFLLKNFDNLMKNGRLSRAKGLLGMVLGFHPIFADNGDGEIIVKEKVRGLKQAMDRLAGVVRETMETAGKKPKTLVISHSNCEERAMGLREHLLAICQDLQQVIVVPAGGLTTVYADDGGLVLAF